MDRVEVLHPAMDKMFRDLLERNQKLFLALNEHQKLFGILDNRLKMLEARIDNMTAVVGKHIAEVNKDDD